MVDRGISSQAARKRVERAEGIKRLAGIRFEKNAKFIYHQDQYGDDRFWNALEEAFKTNGKCYWGAMLGLKQRGGACPKSLFSRICGAPIRRKNQLSPETILERLTNIHLIKEVEDEKIGEPWICLNPYFYGVSAPSPEYRAVLMAEYVAIQAIADWARKLGFGSYGKFAVRGQIAVPEVSGIAWDITAPSYMRPLVSVLEGKIKPGFFVCDVALGHQITNEEVELFIRKYDIEASPHSMAPLMGFLVADGFMQTAYDKARSSGLIACTTSQLFGEDLAKSLNDLIRLLSDAGRTAAVNPEHLEKVINSLSRIEGASANLRGSLFELVVGNLLVAVTGGYLTVGRKIADLAEIDVIIDRPEEAPTLIVECKAKMSGSMVSLADVQKWYNKSVPVINETIRQYDIKYKDKKLEFEIWTNGRFHPSAVKWLNKQETEFENHSLAWREGSYVKEYSQNDNVSKHTRDILKEHYFKNALTMVTSEE